MTDALVRVVSAWCIIFAPVALSILLRLHSKEIERSLSAQSQHWVACLGVASLERKKRPVVTPVTFLFMLTRDLFFLVGFSRSIHRPFV